MDGVPQNLSQPTHVKFSLVVPGFQLQLHTRGAGGGEGGGRFGHHVIAHAATAKEKLLVAFAIMQCAIVPAMVQSRCGYMTTYDMVTKKNRHNRRATGALHAVVDFATQAEVIVGARRCAL